MLEYYAYIFYSEWCIMFTENKQFWRSVIPLAIPIALQNLLISCASLIDTAMIIPLGNTALSAVGVAGRFTFMLNLVAFGFCSGAATLISQFWGVDDKKHINNSFALTLLISMTFTLLYSAVTFIFPGTCITLFGPEPDVAAEAAKYLRIVALSFPFSIFSQVACAALRATEQVRLPLVTSFVSVGLNTFLNFCLISGQLGFPALGVSGAAIATAIATVVQAIIIFLYLLFADGIVRFSAKDALQFEKDFVSKFVSTMGPVLLNETLWGLGTNIYVMVLSRQGTEEYSAYTIFTTIEQLLYVFFKGLCHAAAILIGKASGRGDNDEAYKLAKKFLIITPLTAVITGIIIAFLRAPILSMFAIETQRTKEIASSILLTYCLIIGARMIPYTAICGIFRAGGDVKTGCIYELVCLYFICIPSVYIAGMLLHVPFTLLVPIMFVSEDLPKLILCLRHFIKRNWIRKLTDSDAVSGTDNN